jgi:hypothetical protein
VSFMPLPLYPWEKSRWELLDRRLGGPQIQSGAVEKSLGPVGN